VAVDYGRRHVAAGHADALTEADLIIDYFHGAMAGHLEQVGVDPTRLPPCRRWTSPYAACWL
jgi:hypothetical protein